MTPPPADTVVALSQLRFAWPASKDDTLNLPSLTIARGEHAFIRGQSGSGKTTLLNLLAGILTPSDGTLTLLNQPLDVLSTSARDRFRAHHMGIIFQQFNLLPYLSTIDNVTLPCQFSTRRKERAGNMTATAIDLLEGLDLNASLYNRPITALSVGQQQRVAVARALIGQPEIILADEPTSALDSNTRDIFLQLLFDQADSQSTTIIFVSHDAQIANAFPQVIELPEVNQA